MEKELTLSCELMDLALLLMEIIKREFKAHAGVNAPTLTQFRMLHVIKEGICHVGKLSEAFGISQPAASIMVDTMVKDGLLKRVPDPRDRRQIELRLTARATASFDAIYKRAFTKIDGRLSDLSAARKKVLAKQIREISGILSKATNRPETRTEAGL
jgi:DNA-binding MarR family transcriptional regulator